MVDSQECCWGKFSALWSWGWGLGSCYPLNPPPPLNDRPGWWTVISVMSFYNHADTYTMNVMVVDKCEVPGAKWHSWLMVSWRPEFEESFNSKMRMPGTVKCRPTVAYWVQIDGINIATELITRYYLNETLIQCCFNVRSTSATLAQHWINLQCLRESPPTQQTQNICITFIQRWPNVFDVCPTLHKVIQMFCVYWVSIQARGHAVSTSPQ